MSKLPRMIAAVAFVLLTVMLVRKWTGGGSGGGGGGGEIERVPEPPAFAAAETFSKKDPANRTLSWKRPGKREDGSALPKTDLLSYVVVLLPASAETDFAAPFNGLNNSEFRKHGQQINRALAGSSLGEFVKRYSAYATVVPASQTNMVVPLGSETVYAAIAAVDGNGLYGELSETVALKLE